MAWEDETKPTFFFGELARAQLVSPIEGDVHFDDSWSSMEELSAELEESRTIMNMPANLPIYSDDGFSSPRGTIFHIERQQREGGHERIQAVSQGDNAQPMRPIANPEHASARAVD